MTLPNVWRRVRAHRLIATAIVAVLLFAMIFVSVPPVRHTVESKLPRMPWSPKLTATTPLWPTDSSQRRPSLQRRMAMDTGSCRRTAPSTRSLTRRS
jgi:hypothetical protein